MTALRATMLRCRHLQSKTEDTPRSLVEFEKLLKKAAIVQVDKADDVKMQKEKARLERLQREEKAIMEAQIKAAEAASRGPIKRSKNAGKQNPNKKCSGDQEREAACLALQKMEKIVEIDENLEILKDLEMLSGSALSDFGLGSGEDDYLGDDDNEAILDADKNGEEGKRF
ncbi:nuclear protein X1 [Actinidia rufa]|uniref:Nuclear protein X1 n=1 Tax=Actinidia rufa TaxID=165716 RepID=A0A7J0G5W5_9ERIC|nr:nuclear protein X1 [Actinidia rufa]